MAKILDKFKQLLTNSNETTANNHAAVFAGINTIDYNQPILSPTEMLSLSYVTRSIQMIANDVAKVEWNHYKFNALKTERHLKGNSTMHWMLNRAPNSEQTAFEFKKMLVWNLFIYGSAPIYPVYKDGTLIELLLINPHAVKLVRDQVSGLIKYEVDTAAKPLVLNADQLIYITFEQISNVYDVSFASIFKSTLGKLKENERVIYNTIKNDTGLSMFIEVPDMTNKQTMLDVEQSIRDMVSRQKKSGSLAMVKDKRWNILPNNNYIKSQIDYQTRNAIAREVAAMFGIPPSKLGIEDSNKYNTMVERNRAYADDALKPILNRITTVLTNFFYLADMTQEITFNSLDLLSLDPASMQAFATSAINNAFMTPNEARLLIGLEPIKGGDDLFANSALVPVELSKAKAKAELENLKKPVPPQQTVK